MTIDITCARFAELVSLREQPRFDARHALVRVDNVEALTEG